MASTGYRDTGARLYYYGSTINIAVSLDYTVTRSDNVVTFTGLNQYYKYERLSGSVTSFSYPTGWEAYTQIPSGVANRTGQFAQGTRNVNQVYGPTGGANFSITVASNATTTTGRVIGRYLNDAMTYSSAFNITIPTLGSPALTSQSVTNLKTTSATVTSAFSAGSNSTGIASVQLQYGLTTSYGTNLTDSTSPYTWNLTGLKPGQTYHYRFVATNKGGKVTTTEDFTFKTKAAAGMLPLLLGLIT